MLLVQKSSRDTLYSKLENFTSTGMMSTIIPDTIPSPLPSLEVTQRSIDINGNIGEGILYFSYYSNDLEMLAGMAAVLLPILSDLNDDDYGNGIHRYQLHSTGNLQKYRLKRHLREADISTTVLKLAATDKVWWIRNQSEFFYDAYVFTSSSFLQGLFTIFNYFGADYRNYLYGLPYDGLLNVLELPEYGIVASNIFASDAPDIDDIEAEEADDENVIGGFERSDEIITITSTENLYKISSPDEGNQEVYVV